MVRDSDAEIAGTEEVGIPVEDIENRAVWPLFLLPEQAAHVLALVYTPMPVVGVAGRFCTEQCNVPRHTGNGNRVKRSLWLPVPVISARTRRIFRTSPPRLERCCCRRQGPSLPAH